MDTTQTVTIDGKPYPLNALSEIARSQIINLRAAEQEIARAQALLAMLQTARQAYAQTLKAELDKMAPLETMVSAGNA
ncbi:MAG: DUF6447 family protein [Zoogloeaceae bacterium]|jgi:hypothetical protein|nr:DUF6447 family protein [Zoogloeaceae bacterium]